jgi:chromate transporter
MFAGVGRNAVDAVEKDVHASAPPLRELALFFLKLGTIAFGGPAAHIAMMEDELVGRRKWIARQEFLDLLGVANLLPGPSSTELAIFIGYRLRKLSGLVVAGVCFILPAFLIVSVIAWAYVRYGSIPAAIGILYGAKPVVIAIVLQALSRLFKSAVKSTLLAAIALVALLASVLGMSPVLVLFGSAIIAAAIYGVRNRSSTVMPLALPPKLLPLTAGISASVSLGGIFLVFLKLGCVVFGSGYVLLAFLRADLVVHRHWLTESQLLDAVAVGQVTPGPVFTTATFIGYLLAGPKGAVAATVGIFAPAFVFVAATGPIVRRLRASKLAGAMLDGLNVASLALMAAVTWQLAKAAVFDWATLAIALVSAVLLLRLRVNSTWLVAGGAAVGAGLMLASCYH